MNDSISTPLSPIPKQGDENLVCYKWLRHVYIIDKYIEKILSILIVLFTTLLTFLMFSQVILRYIIKLPFLGIEELAPLFAVWAYFLAIWYAARTREHIGGGMLVLVVKNERIIKLVRLIGSIISFVILIIFAYYAYKIMVYNIEVNRLSSYMKVPRYFWSMSSVVGLWGCAICFGIQICVEVVDFFVNTRKKHKNETILIEK